MKAAIDDWIAWLTINRSPATVEGYGWEVRHLAGAFPDKRAGDFTPADLHRYLAERRQTGCGDAAIKRSVNALRSFFLFACGPTSPAAALPMPRPKKRMQRTLSLDQAFAVLAACDTSSVIGVRDLALMSLMLDSGIRASEVCRLQLDKLDLDGREFYVRVKGGQEESGLFGVNTANYLSTWLTVRERIAREDADTVFVGIGGLHPGGPLTTDGLRRVFHRIGRLAGLKGFSPHDLRRTFATTLTLLEAPSRLSQMWGRWGNLQEFERYTQALLSMRLHGEFEKYSPVRAALHGRSSEP